MAAEAGNKIVGRSLQTMIGQLNGTRPKRHLLGPVALEEAWMEAEHVGIWEAEHGDNNGNKNEDNHFLRESPIDDLQNRKLPNQNPPTGYGDPNSRCLYTRFNYCNFAVMDESDDTIYFYSRIQGTVGCQKRMRESEEDCMQDKQNSPWTR